LAREDLDAIESRVLAALRRGRKARPAGVPWGKTLQLAEDSQRIPAFAQTAGPTIWAGDTALVQRRRGVATPQTPPVLSPTKKALSSSATAPCGLGSLDEEGRASLRRTAQLPPRRKPKDLYDLMVEFEDEDHVRYEEQRKQKVQAQRAAFRKGLDRQLEEKSRSRQAAEEEFRATRTDTLARAEAHRQQESEAVQQKAQRAQRAKQQMAEEMEALSQRRGAEELQRQRDREDLDQALAHQKRLSDEKARAKQVELEQQGLDSRERSKRAAELRRQQRAAEKEEDARIAAAFARRCDERQAEGNKEYLARQKVVDHRAPMGVTANAPLLQRERAEEARVDRSILARSRQVEGEHWQKIDTMGAEARQLKLEQADQAEKARKVRGRAEREAGLEQAAIWRCEDEEHWARERQAKEREKQNRKTLDSELCQRLHQDKQMHRMDLGNSAAIGGSEYAYHKTITSRMASTGFRPDQSATLLSKVSAERVGKVGQ